MTNRMVRTAEGWSVRYEGREIHLPDIRGLHAIAYLLARPGAEVHASELVAAWRGEQPREARGVEAERARINVTRAIKAAVDRIAQAHPVLGEHLRATVHTGLYCRYAPDPRLGITWE